MTAVEPVPSLVEQFKGGLDAPICLTWEWTYACNLTCEHCLSSSGRRDPRELSTAEMKAVIDALRRHPIVNASIDGDQVVYHPSINLGIAVALETGLIVPVVRNADERNLLGLSRAIADVADKPALFQADRLHPNAQAHPIILNNIWPTFSTLIASR